MVGILGILPLMFAASIWQLVAMVIAVRQALDYTSTGRAVAVCVLGFLAQLAVIFLFVVVIGGALAAMFAGGSGTVTP